MDKENFRNISDAFMKAYSSLGYDFAVGSNNPWDIIFVMDKLRDELFTLKDTRLSARVLNHWKNNNILPLSRTGGWNKFSLLELVWIDIVIALRGFGLSLQKIASVRDQLFQPIKLNKDDKSVDIDKFYSEIYSKHKRIFSSNLLGGYIGYMLIKRKPVILTVFSNGECSINDTGNFTPYDEPFFTIPLFPIIQYFILDHKNRVRMMDLGVITEEEQLILDSIRNGDANTLTIKIGKGRKISLIEEGKEVDLHEVRKQVGQIISKAEYGEIILKYKNGKIVNAQRSDSVYHE